MHLLTDLIVDDKGKALIPVHASNHGKRYRYYVSGKDQATEKGQTWRLPTDRIEPIVEEQLQTVLADESRLAEWMTQYQDGATISYSLDAARAMKALYPTLDDPQRKRAILHSVFTRIIMSAGMIRFEIAPEHFVASLSGDVLTANS